MHHAAAISANDVPVGTMGGHGQRAVVLCVDACAAFGGLGNVVRGQLSHRDVWPGAFAADSSGEPDALRGLAQDAYNPGVSFLPDISGTLHGSAVSYAGYSGWASQPHGPMVGPFIQNRYKCEKVESSWH